MQVGCFDSECVAKGLMPEQCFLFWLSSCLAGQGAREAVAWLPLQLVT